MTFCTRCGGSIANTDRFCGMCGAPLETVSAGQAMGQPRGSTDAIRVARDRLEQLAGVLGLAWRQGCVSQDKYSELHLGFLASDDEARIWTIGIQSHSWHKWDGDDWVPGSAPMQLLMDRTIHDQLTALETVVRRSARGAKPLTSGSQTPVGFPAQMRSPEAANNGSQPSSGTRGAIIAIVFVVAGGAILFQMNSSRQGRDANERIRQMSNPNPVFQPGNQEFPAMTPADNVMPLNDSAPVMEFQLSDPQDQKQLEDYLLKEIQNQNLQGPMTSDPGSMTDIQGRMTEK